MAWRDVDTAQPLIDFSAKYAPAFEAWARKRYASYPDELAYALREPFAIRIKADDNGRYLVKLGTDTHMMAAFNFEGFPHCCAMMLLHGFTYNNGYTFFTKEVFNEFLDVVLTQQHWGMYFSSKRFAITMIPTHGLEQATRENILKDYEPIQTDFVYPWFHEWIHKQTKCKCVDVMLNKNSNRLVHEFHVIL